MSDKLGTRQHHILKLLLENKSGLTIDALASELAISRNAVQQHITVLERDGYIQSGGLSKTAGRPVRCYQLTAAGINCFPKQYAWFAELVLSHLKQELTPESLEQYLHTLGHSVAEQLASQFNDKNTEQRVQALLAVMNQLGFSADVNSDGQTTEIRAHNCIYHDLAQKHPEICELDKSLIKALTQRAVEHKACMAKGDNDCVFKLS
ncbi:helix-turn-helix transcriptional regulator [Methylocucumis oryzae]|uniref:Transcriptional regulator n=1 Tax=Methylocucumis oryzae TaxID=1632867 RepID=A0A0F3IKH7_9GAMM|nr:HTH domain-containing protein [Methylocucumis oryzae]KJV07240.1 transcriptional regulator [Methylocucumis oryzae]